MRLRCSWCRYGLKKLLLDGNPLGSAGLEVFAEGLVCNDTITHLGLSECGYRTEAAVKLLEALKDNSTLLTLETKRNRVTREMSTLVHAEIEANNCLLKITSNVKAVDANKLSVVVSDSAEACVRWRDSIISVFVRCMREGPGQCYVHLW